MPGKDALLVVVGGVALVVLLPVILPVVAVLDALDRRRLRTAAATFACTTCGRLLGIDALHWTEPPWTDYTVAARAHPGARLRMVKTADAVCPRCETRYAFRKVERTFVPEGQPAHAATDPPRA